MVQLSLFNGLCSTLALRRAVPRRLRRLVGHPFHFNTHWCTAAATIQIPKLDTRTTASGICFLKQNRATRKKRMLGRIPQRAPLAKFCMISGLPLFSTYIHTRTSAPVSGMTPTRPAADGNLLPIAVAVRITATLKMTLIRICISYLSVQSIIRPILPGSNGP